jgi:hypothetical protein
MARRRGGEDEGVSLFPFLSIIACVIGVLTLLISTLSLAQMGTEDVASLEQYEKIKQELEELQAEIERLKGQLGEEALQRANAMDERQRALAAARERLDQLLKQIIALRQLLAELEQQTKKTESGAPKDATDATVMRDELATLKSRMEQLEEDLTGQKEQLAQLEKELEKRNKPPEEAEVSVLPSGSGLGFEPLFVECAGGSVVIHQGDQPQRIRAADLGQDEDFLRLLAMVAASEKKSIVFLLRDNGLGTYRTAGGLADMHEARHGKLPVIGQGRLDLSYFTKKN